MAKTLRPSLGGALLATLASAAILIPNLAYPYFEDTAIVAVIAKGLSQGKTLYVDLFDHKGPAVYLQEWLRLRILGDSALAHRLFEMLFLLWGGGVLGRGVGGLWREGDEKDERFLAAVTTLAFALSSSSALWGLPDRGQVEFYQAALVAAGLGGCLLAKEKSSPAWSALSAAWLAWACWMKPQWALLLIVLWAIQWVDVKKGRSPKGVPIAFASGVALTTLIVVGFLFKTGAAKAYYSILVRHYPAYLHAIAQPKWALLKFLPYLYLRGVRSVAVAILAVLGGVYFVQSFRNDRIDGGQLTLLLTPGPIAFVMYLAGGMGWKYHTIPLAMPLAIYATGGCLFLREAFLQSRLPERMRRPQTAWALWCAGFLAIGYSGGMPRDLKDTWAWVGGDETLFKVHLRRGNEMAYYRYADQLKAANAVKQLAPQGKAIAVFGLGAVTYLNAGRPMAIRYFLPALGYMPYYALRNEAHKHIHADLLKHQPEVLLLQHTDDLPWFGLKKSSLERLQQDKQIGPWVQSHYRTVGWIGKTYMVMKRCPQGICRAKP